MPEMIFNAQSCARSSKDYQHVLLGHGSGGRMTADLIQQVFLPALNHPVLAALEDQATLPLASLTQLGGRLALTTDAFVVQPIFFPGGDIGRLAVNGTINDLAVGGAEPLYLAASFIIEEGLSLGDLRQIVESMSAACREAGIALVAADTKVVERGKGDQLFITTTGVGTVLGEHQLSIHSARPGDRILVSGTIGDHGIAIMSVREGLEFETVLQSDTAPLHRLAGQLLMACPKIRAMRDPTRGGLSGTLHELAAASRVGIKLAGAAIPLRREVRAACEMLGLDPLYVANEGKLVAVVADEDAERALQALREHPLGRDAAIVGEVVADHPGTVTVRTPLGGEHIVIQLAGEQLPRIC